MARPDVVAYLHSHLNDFPVEELKRQLLAEGVTEDEFKAALTATQTRRKKARARVLFGRVLLTGGLVLVAVALWVWTQQQPKPAGDQTTVTTLPASQDVSAFLGHSGYVLKLPKGYVAVQTFRDDNKDDEIVHICPAGTDPTNFLNEGLYGQLGIVRLEVMPSPYAGQITGIDALVQEIAARSRQRGEKYSLKNVQVSTMRGVQLTFDAPDARVETYVLGQKVLYYFMAGQDDEIYRSILQSLRDADSET